MQRCMGIKGDGERCETHPPAPHVADHLPHLHFCRRHWRVYNRRVEIRQQMPEARQLGLTHLQPRQCHKWNGHEWCERERDGESLLCVHHSQQHLRRQEGLRRRQEHRDRLIALEQHYRESVPAPTWRQVIDDLFMNHPQLTRADAHHIALNYFLQPVVFDLEFHEHWQFQLYWRWNINGRNGPPPDLTVRFVPQLQAPPVAYRVPPAAPTLAAISLDRQNVHTRAVSEQTNKGLEILLNAGRGFVMRSPEWMASRWLLRGYANWTDVVMVVNDMQRWYGTETCRTHRDWLYRTALNGLYMLIRKIENNETKTEVYQRVYEECKESVGMCCDGHISRLCNVLVGFDEAFAPPVPFGEILQNKMAAIAALEVDTDEKVRQAMAFFEEFAVPATERSAWLEAF